MLKQAWPPCELNISCTSTTAESRALRSAWEPAYLCFNDPAFFNSFSNTHEYVNYADWIINIVI